MLGYAQQERMRGHYSTLMTIDGDMLPIISQGFASISALTGTPPKPYLMIRGYMFCVCLYFFNQNWNKNTAGVKNLLI